MAARNKVMVLNAGSSSLKFKLFELSGGAATGFKAVASGICERIGDPYASFLRVRGLRGPCGMWVGAAAAAAAACRRCLPRWAAFDLLPGF
jgi:hypothetical protein